MAKKTVNVFIGAKNKMGAGLRAASRNLKKFGRGAGKIMRGVATGVAVLGTAVVGLSVKMIKAWSIQESAEKSLSEALRAQGDAVVSLMAKYKKLASAIQDETGVADESTLALISKLRTIGVSNEKMEQAVKLTMALAKAGMREKTAFRAAADAMNGNTTALTTYIPELRQATTQAEKLAIVNDLAVRGYKQLSGELDTNAGRWNELKGRIGDVFEQIGKVISGGLSLKDTLATLSDKIKSFGSSPKFEAFLERLQSGVKQVKDLINVLTGGGEKSRDALVGIAGILKASLIVAGEKVANILKKAAPEIGRLIASGMAGMVKAEAGRRGTRSAAREAVSREMGQELGVSYESARTVIESKGMMGEFNRRVEEMTGRMIEMNAAANNRTISTKGLTAAEADLKDRLDVLVKSIKPINQDDMLATKPMTLDKFRVDAMKSTPFSASDIVSVLKPTAVEMAIAKPPSDLIGGNGATVASEISADTSMLSTSDLVTLMQTGQQANSELGELQSLNSKMDTLIEEVKDGGVR